MEDDIADPVPRAEHDPFRAFIDSMTNMQTSCALMRTAINSCTPEEAESHAHDALSWWLAGKAAFRRFQRLHFGPQAPHGSLQELGLVAAALDAASSRFDDDLQSASKETLDARLRGVLQQLRQSLAILRLGEVPWINGHDGAILLPTARVLQRSEAERGG